MKQAITSIAYVIATLVLFDLLILLIGLAQIGLEGETGLWHPFWQWQARFIVRMLGR